MAQPTAPKISDPGIESELLQLPWLQGVEFVPLTQKFFADIAPKLRLPRTSHQILHAFARPDVSADDIAQALRENPYYEFQFLKMIDSLSKREDQPSVEAAVPLLGMTNSRNLILAMQLLRTVQGVHPPWDDNGKLQMAPKDTIQLTLKLEESLGQKKEVHAETTYGAALIYDYLAQISGVIGADAKAPEVIKEFFSASLRVANVSRGLGDVLPDITYKKYLFGTCLAAGVGQAIFALLDPAYPAFVEEFKEKGGPPQLRSHLEQKKYKVSHPLFAALACHHFGVLKPVAAAILFQDVPYYLKERNKNAYQLACAVNLCLNVAANFKKPTGLQDVLLGLWKSPETVGIQVDSAKLTAAVEKLVQKGLN
ncbi:MAG: HDOD domain-containing protein [Bacteriovoracia bacterium]